MANPAHVEAVRSGNEGVEAWRKVAKDTAPLDLTQFDFTGAAFDGLRCVGANFHGSTLSGASFRRSHFLGANFRDAHLAGADFSNACLVEADFSGADLSSANFTRANLCGATLLNARIGDASFAGASLNRAVLPANHQLADFADAGTRYAGAGDVDDPKARIMSHHVMHTLLKTARETNKGLIETKLDFQMFKLALSVYGQLLSDLVAFVSWPLVRQYGALHILTRASYLLLVAVPVLAFLWPVAERVVSIEETALQATLVSTIEAKATVDQARSDTRNVAATDAHLAKLSARMAEFISKLEMRPRYELHFPQSLAALYFAAIFVAFGHLLYQVWADDVIKETSRSKAIAQATSGFQEGSSEALLRLGDALREIQNSALAAPDEYHPQLVRSGGALVWMPSHPDKFSQLPAHHKWAALEAAAAIRFDRAAKKALLAAALSLSSYAIATALVVYAVSQQAHSVLTASGVS